MDAYEYAQTDREMLAKAQAAEVKTGDDVKIVKGAHEGLFAKVGRVNYNTDEVNVFLEIVGSGGRFAPVPTTVSLRWLEPVR